MFYPNHTDAQSILAADLLNSMSDILSNNDLFPEFTVYPEAYWETDPWTIEEAEIEARLDTYIAFVELMLDGILDGEDIFDLAFRRSVADAAEWQVESSYQHEGIASISVRHSCF